MQTNRKLAVTTLLVASLLTSLLFLGTAQAQGQLPAYVGKFTLPYQVRWGGTILPAGDYTLTIQSTRSPMIALIRTADRNAVTYVMNGSLSGHTNGANALLIKERGGQLIVHSLALADLGKLLIYDPSLARESVKEARATQLVPVMWVKK